MLTKKNYITKIKSSMNLLSCRILAFFSPIEYILLNDTDYWVFKTNKNHNMIYDFIFGIP